MYRKGKAINRNLVYPTLNAIHTNKNDIRSSVHIIEVNSDGEAINTESRNNIDRPLFDTHNDLLIEEYERNLIERNAIIDADKYYDYFSDEKTKYDSNLRDIFTDIYSDMHCDISSIPSTSNTDDIQYYKSIKNFVSSSSSDDSLTHNIFEPKSRKKWCKYNTIFGTNTKVIETECIYERYFKNVNLSPLTTPTTDEDDDIVTNKVKINRISTPVPHDVPKITVQTRPSLPTVPEIVESSLTENSTERENKNTNRWLNESENMRGQIEATRERYFSWIPLWVNDKNNLLKIKKDKSINQHPNKRNSFISYLRKDSKTIEEENEIDVENISNKSSQDTNKPYTIEMEDIEIKSYNDNINVSEVGIEQIETETSKSTSEETERLEKLQINVSMELEQIKQVNGFYSEESNDSAKQNNLKSESNFSQNVCEISAGDSCENNNTTINSVIKTDTRPTTSIPSLHLSTISEVKTGTWMQKVSKYFCCLWKRSKRTEHFSVHLTSTSP